MPAAFLLAHVWKNYIENDEYRKPINISIYIWGGICITVAYVAMFTMYYLPHELNETVETIKWFSIILFFIFGVMSVISAAYHKKVLAFASYVLLVVVLSAFGTRSLFKIDYKFGQNDLMQFAKYAKENNKQIMTFGFQEKYSLLYYAGEHILYETDGKDYTLLQEKLDDPRYVVIFKNKNMKDILQNLHYDEFEVVKTGVKYSLVTGEN